MTNNIQLTEQSTSIPPTTVLPIEPMVLLDEQKSSSSFLSVNKIFAFSLFILLIVLVSYILFHNTVTDTKLNRLANDADFNSNDIKQLLEEMDRTFKSIEILLSGKALNQTISSDFS